MSADPANVEGYMAINRQVLNDAFDYYRIKCNSNIETLSDFLKKALHVHDDSYGFNCINDIQSNNQQVTFYFNSTGRWSWEYMMPHFLTNDGYDRWYFAEHNDNCWSHETDEGIYVLNCNHQNQAENSLRFSCLFHHEIKNPIYQLYEETCEMNDYDYFVFSTFELDLPDLKFKKHDLDYYHLIHDDVSNRKLPTIDRQHLLKLINHSPLMK